MRDRQSGKPSQRLVADAGQYLGYGMTWALSTGLFLFLGWLLDRWLGTLPLFLILGAFIGAGAGFYSLYHHLVVEPRERAKREESEERGGRGERRPE